ncbi:tetratricopeptide repeat protein (plasmid) [Nostoc sp. C052]|uniref:CHAT domain-containing protein n=1 Tax=Nostoc sp. C052 TaxID=2576902 RepID=UPI0015C2CDDD|nr:CHAT domain-containing protein [Nostoc sp. C052]QLE45741.1 tetratricopeptide repeat protein [Nostoc sp. C052]
MFNFWISEILIYIAWVISNFSNLICQFPLGNKASNIEIAITCYKIALSIYIYIDPPYWAMTQVNLGEAYRRRIKGDNSDNLEQAIATCTEALEILTRKDFPQYWAMAHNNRGNAYAQRVRGDKAENLEQAITAYTNALEILTRKDFPQYWSRMQYSLGLAYSKRINGDKTENLEQAITAYTNALEILTRKNFPQEWVMIQANLGNAYAQRVRGNKAENLEQAITAYTNALEILTRKNFPQEWVMIQANLGNAYAQRVRGNKAENLEQAITACTAALEILNREDFSKEWVMIQAILGETYRNRIRGDKAENLEQAITACKKAQLIYIRDNFPQEWAMVQANLGNAYVQRISGNKAANLEQAITAHTEALEIYTRAGFPQQWAMIQISLGDAYRSRIRGDKAANLEQAITACTAALEICTREDFPQEWAMIQLNLGIVYYKRIRGDKAENLEQAITACTEALKIYTKADFPQEWVKTQNNLGLVYSERIREDKAENLEQAIITYTVALEVCTRASFPQEWAMIQLNLGIVYYKRIRGDKAENLEQAIIAYTAALEIFTRADAPQAWASIQNNLGEAYRDRIRGDKAANLEQAIAACTAGLEIYNQVDFPEENVHILYNLGLVYQKTQQLNLAYTSFAAAIETVEGLREEIVSGDDTKRKQAEEWNRIYIGIVEVCIESGNITQAVEYVERSKTRNLVESILNKDFKTIFPLEVVIQLEQIRDEITISQYNIQNGRANDPKILSENLQKLRRQRNDLQNKYLPVGYSFKLDSFLKTLDAKTAVIQWYLTPKKIIAFVIKSQGQEINVWQSQLEDRQNLSKFVSKYLQNYFYTKDKWHTQLDEEIKKLSSLLYIDEILDKFLKNCDQLILIPHLFLHLFPLHAIPKISQDSQDSPCIQDLFVGGVSYAPSCQLLQLLQKRQRHDFQSLFVIQNPTEDLIYTDLEVDNILNFFSSHQLFSYKQATKATLLQQISQLKKANCLHFSCHGSFNFNSPQDSCLKLAGSVDENGCLDLSQCLTLDNLFEQDFQLDNCRLVILSACETGLIDFTNRSDEYISLTSGFLYAGSTSVVSSLWTVNDFSTAFLMIKFLQNLKAAMADNGNFSVGVELQKAQIWLRDATTAELQAWVSKLQLTPEQAENIESSLDWFDSDEQPFENPYWWAAFCAIG